MPGESFYAGLALPEKLRKFLDHHSEKKTRHISAYEAQMLDSARARLEQTIAVAKSEAEREVRATYESLIQLYETLIAGEQRAISVRSFPAWHLVDPSALLVEEAGLIELVREPTPGQVQAAVVALLTTGGSAAALVERYRLLEGDARRVQSALDDETFAVVNRLLYQPTVIAENSWADVASLLDHLSRAKSKGSPVIIFGGTLAATGSPIVAFLAGGSVIALQLLQSVADGMMPGLRGLGETLTRSWRPSTEVEVDGS